MSVCVETKDKPIICYWCSEDTKGDWYRRHADGQQGINDRYYCYYCFCLCWDCPGDPHTGNFKYIKRVIKEET